MNALLRQAGSRIAELAKVPAGYTALPTTGAAAGLALSVSACLCRNDISIAEVLPDVSKLAMNEVVVGGGSDLRWIPSVALTGAKIVHVGKPGQPMTAAGLRA